MFEYGLGTCITAKTEKSYLKETEEDEKENKHVVMGLWGKRLSMFAHQHLNGIEHT